MAKQTSPVQRVGDNGYYYFTYDRGAEYEVKTHAGVAVYEILNGIYRDGVESYTIRVTSGGMVKERELTLQRLSYVFDSTDKEPMYLKRPKKLPQRMFEPHNKDLDIPEHLKEKYDKNNQKKNK